MAQMTEIDDRIRLVADSILLEKEFEDISKQITSRQAVQKNCVHWHVTAPP